MIVDNRPLQKAAWGEFHTARKRLDKVSADLHRHEEIDVPAYETWMHRTFPVFITTLRQLHEEVFVKGSKVHAVEEMSYYTGRSLKKLWQELKEREANPEAFKDEPPSADEDDDKDDEKDFFGDDPQFDWGDDLSGKRKQDNEEPNSGQSRRGAGRKTEMRSAPSSPPRGNALGKDLYRRLVQRLHPDRGGEWTPARERLWHQVQQAWANGDVDWLIRLEVEWETANDILGPTSPVGRLRLAIEELHAARRDIERKLRDYRGSPAWRFTLSEKNRQQLHRRTEENFRHDLTFLRRQLDYLNATIAAWERVPRASRRPKQSSARGKTGTRDSNRTPPRAF